MVANSYIVVFITAPTKRGAEKIVRGLIKKRLVACGNILGGVDSRFVWKKKTQRAEEVLIILKTKRILFKRIISEVEKLHSYEVPEIIALPIIGGNRKYLKWIDENTSHF